MNVALAILSGIAPPVLAVVLVGVVNRVKSRWSGRRGPPILQLGFDIVRLVQKRPVYSSTTTPVFRIAPYVVLVTAVGSSLVAPVLGSHAPISFPFDFVMFAYLWALGRVALMLGGLDTGSAFEGMGVSREATYSALLEPALFLVTGALCLGSGQRTLEGALHLPFTAAPALGIWLASIVALTIIVQVESARMPVDDPTTHLELTMIHEVMILDHSGPELAALELAAGIKLAVGVSLIATLLNPLERREPGLTSMVVNVVLCVLVAAAIGTVESLIARLRLRVIPQYILVGVIAGGLALLATTWAGTP